MPRFAANLSMLFTEHRFPERFDHAAKAGFTAVEFLFPYDEDIDAIAEALKRNILELVLFNLPAGDFSSGERGIANDPGRTQAFRAGVSAALEIADRLACTRLNCLSGLTSPDPPRETQMATLRDNLRFAADACSRAEIRLVVEPLNTIDTPGFILSTAANGLALISEIDHPNLALQLDIYHAYMMGEDPLALIRDSMSQIGHVQIADSPGRHQPGTGTIDFGPIFTALDRADYSGWVSLEYRPEGETVSSLAWLDAYR
ncbi:MAG: TIM barrel protein [Chloroflexota bacterium]|nr:TIM barrel protein [Chloroflexota bacterium]